MSTQSALNKVCWICKRELSITRFFKAKNNKDGYKNYCKDCNREIVKRYRHTKEGKEANKRWDKKYQQTVKGKITVLKRSHRHYMFHCEEIKEKKRRYRAFLKRHPRPLENVREYDYTILAYYRAQGYL